MAETHRLNSATRACIMCALLCTSLVEASQMPPTVKSLDTQPDRGNNERYAYITGPTTPIARFYNEDMEMSFWSQPPALTFSVAKNDVWDRRYFADSKKIITLEDVRRACLSGKVGRHTDLGLPNTAHALYHEYDFPCPKPVGQIIIRCADIEGHDRYTAGETAGHGVVAEAAKDGARVSVWAELHRTKNLLVVRGECAGLTQPIRVQFYRHKDTTPRDMSIVTLCHYGGKSNYDYAQDRPHNGPLPDPEAGRDGPLFWVRQKFHADKTFPKGFEYVMMGFIDGASCETTTENRAVRAGEGAIVHAIEPDVHKRLAGWLRERRMGTERVNNADYGSLATATLEPKTSSFRLYVAVVTTRDAADPLAAAKAMLTEARQAGAERLMEQSASATEAQVRAWRNSRVMHYNATSCTYADSTPWHGDYHFNEGYFLPTIVSGGAHTLEQRLLMFEGMLPALKRNAREVYDCSGICFPLVHYPIKSDRVVYASVTWEFGLENTALMLQPYWHIFQYTQDKDFLRTRAYPMMREGARFYADYVTKGDDGCYHVIPTVSQEHWGFTPKFKLNRDSVGALSFVKYHLRACIRASEILGLDADERGRWHEIVAHLAPYPTLETKDGPVFCDMRDAPRLLNYNITANLVMALWAEDISLDSPPDILEMARRSYRAIPDKEHSPRKGYLQRIALHLGMTDKLCLWPQGRVLSWPGRIHLYAGVPKGLAVNDHFSGLLAVGGFEVSASHFGTKVGRLRIKSMVGGKCKVKSPWHPAQVVILDMAQRQKVTHVMDRDTIAFDTEPGHTYAVLPPTELQIARMRFVPKVKSIGRWTFDQAENGLVRDESGCGHHAKLVGGAALVPRDAGQALDLPGPQSYARVERTGAFDFAPTESFSVEAKLKIDHASIAAMTPIVCSMATRQYCLLLKRGYPRFYLSSPTGSVYSYVDGKKGLADGQWHHLRAVRDVAEGTLKLYVDAALDGESGDCTGGDFSSDAPIAIGAYLYGSRTQFGRGQIDEVEIKSLGKLVHAPAEPE